jgi:hypothetical protein
MIDVSDKKWRGPDMATEKRDAAGARDEELTNQSQAALEGTSVAVSFEQALQDWEKEMEQVFEANRAAERLSAEDFAIRINAKA